MHSKQLYSVAIALAVLVLALGLWTIKVEKGSTERPDELRAGVCLKGTPKTLGAKDDGEFGAAGVVDCAKPHVYEVFDVVDVPKEYLGAGAPTDAQRERLNAAFSGPTTASGKAFQLWANDTCRSAHAKATGLADIDLADGKKGADLDIMPTSNTSLMWMVLLPETWTKQPSLACSTRFTTRSADPATATSAAVKGRLTEKWLTSDIPLSLRDCYTYDADDTIKQLGCGEAQHYAQFIFQFDALDGMDPVLLKAERAAGPDQPFGDAAAKFADNVCASSLPDIVGAPRTEVKLRGNKGAGWAADGAQEYAAVLCELTAYDGRKFDLPAGSVVGVGEKTKIELVPFG